MANRSTWTLIAFLVGVPILIGVGVKLVANRLLPARRCTSHLIAEVRAPDAAHRAVIYLRECGPGAAAGVSTHASVVRADAELPETDGNLLALEGPQKLTATWTDAKHLVIEYGDGPVTFRQTEDVDGVTARLEPR